MPRHHYADHHFITVPNTTSSPGGSLIQIARERGVVSQAELARRLGISQQTISRWECGQVTPSFDNVVRAVGAAGWDLLATLVPQAKLSPKPKWPARRAPEPSVIRPACIELLPFDADSIDESALEQRRRFKLWRAERRRSRGDDQSRPRRRD